MIVNPQHPLAQTKSPIPLEGLDSYRLALPGVSFGIRQILTLAEHQLGVMLNPTLTCNTIAMLKRYSMQGGVTLLPTFVVDEEVEAGRLCTLALHNEIFLPARECI
nr:hypothetical protein GCM10020185_86940 [Pseudomonas brassicacearum subsp. brassicacearum]